MAGMTDRTGRTWQVVVDMVSLKRVKDALDFNLLEMVVDGSELPARLGDPSAPILLCDTLYAIVREQAELLGVSDVEFGRSMTPDALQDGLDAIMEGVVDFFPKSLRPAYKKILAASRRVKTAQEAKLNAVITSEKFDTSLDRQIVSLIDRLPAGEQTSTTDDASSLQDSADASPGDTPSAP